MTAQITKMHRARYTPYTPHLAANNTADPADQRRELAEAAPMWTDEYAPVSLEMSPELAAHRKRLRPLPDLMNGACFGLQVLACVVGLVALIGFTITAEDTAMTQEVAQ